MINFNFILATTVHLIVVYMYTCIPCKDHFVGLYMFIRIHASKYLCTCMDQQRGARYRSSNCLLIFVLNAHVHVHVQCRFVALSPSVPSFLIAGWIEL